MTSRDTNEYVLMVVPSDFPEGDAGSVRDDAFSRIYQSLGYDVFLVGKSKTNANGDYNGTKYVSIYKEAFGIKGSIQRFFFDHYEYRNVIERWISKRGLPKVIHINSLQERTINYLLKMARTNNIPIIHDSVEWYSECEFPRGRWDKAYILKDRLNKKVIREPIRVYAISSFLYDHFRKMGLKCCRIPVIMDIVGTKTAAINDPTKVKLIYAGSPGRKDFLKEIVLGIEHLTDNEKSNIEFNILGATEEQVREFTSVENLSSCIKAHGRVSRTVVQEELLSSDFSVLLRPAQERYAKAGFPTKSIEAMSHGVAMLCNISSDLGMYLSDMNNAVIVDGNTPDAFSAAVRKILKLSRNDINRIKLKARETAEQHFDYRLWVDVVRKMIEE